MFNKNLTIKKLFTIIITISLFYLLTFIIKIDAARKRKKVEKPKTKKVYDPRDRKPSRLSNELYCQICKDIIKETTRSLYNKKRDYEVIDSIEKVCDSKEYMYPIGKI
jgi:hypothetical protein